MKNILVTTANLNCDYNIIGPVSVELSNKSAYYTDLVKLRKKYENDLNVVKNSNYAAPSSIAWSFLYGNQGIQMQELEEIVWLALEEIKDRARKLGANALIGLEKQIRVTDGCVVSFCGTAVRTEESLFKKPARYNTTGTIAYQLTEDENAYEAIIYDCPEDAYLEIPAFHGGLCVRKVSCYEKFQRLKLKGLYFSGGIVEIERSAFNDSKKLEEVIFSENLQIIGSYAFEKCINLKTVLIPYGIRDIRSYAISDCPKATIYTIEKNIPATWAEKFMTEDVKIKHVNETEYLNLLNITE